MKSKLIAFLKILVDPKTISLLEEGLREVTFKN
jgi:hypothetical protein